MQVRAFERYIPLTKNREITFAVIRCKRHMRLNPMRTISALDNSEID